MLIEERSGDRQHTRSNTEAPMNLFLASKSPFRAAILRNAGLDFRVEAASLDERAAEAPLLQSGAAPEDVASVLAEAKALDVSERFPGALTLGADQTLSLGDELFHKPEDMEAARRHLLKLSGRTHILSSALVLARDGEAVWRHVSAARLTMRKLSPAFIGRHLAKAGDAALSSVGAYQVEGEGIQLFEAIEGDYFTIVGLPLLPLLAELRRLGEIDG
jgi:septum formation protein